jgi:hypothetical protein
MEASKRGVKYECCYGEILGVREAIGPERHPSILLSSAMAGFSYCRLELIGGVMVRMGHLVEYVSVVVWYMHRI